MVNYLLDRKHFDYGIPVLDKLLQTKEMPNSFVLYQEQMMKVLQYGGFTASQSYAAIKAIAKKHPEKVLPLKEQFLNGFNNRLIDSGTNEQDAKTTSDKVWTIISDACSYSFNASHSVSVALDSLYTAWAKAHYPYETYVSLLSNYMEKGDKNKISMARSEMKAAFGIEMAPAHFRQDNRSFYIDRENHSISNALSSIKSMGKKVADEMYAMRNNQYDTFVDLLFDMEFRSAINATSKDILIKMGYFKEFGLPGKLLKINEEFTNGENRITKLLKDATTLKRLELLRQYEKDCVDEDIPLNERMDFEIKYFGVPFTTYADKRGQFAVLDVDDKYSPKIQLYNLDSGTVGMMKVKKDLFKKNPMDVGNIIDLIEWKKEQAYQFADGKRVAKPGVFEFWIKQYKIL